MKKSKSMAISLMVLFFQLAIGVSFACPQEKEAPSFVILAVNDVYRIEGIDQGQRGGLARLRTLRMELEKEHPELLLLHAGDFLFPSLLSKSFIKSELKEKNFLGIQMIDVLNTLDGKFEELKFESLNEIRNEKDCNRNKSPENFDARMFVTFGNHEFDEAKWKDMETLHRRICESEFAWLGSNLSFWKDKNKKSKLPIENLLQYKVVESNGIKVGLFGLTTDIQVPEYASFHTVVPVAKHLTRVLREEKNVDVVVAITHLPLSEDKKILDELDGQSGPDLIIGGHEHDKKQEKANGRWILKADADLRTAIVITVTLQENSSPKIDPKYHVLAFEDPIPDHKVLDRVNSWLRFHDQEFCAVISDSPGCLKEEIGKTQVQLNAEELQIRKYETNFGNYIADIALSAFADQGAQAAFLNSGSMRLNQDIPKGSSITRRHLYELFPYSNYLKMLRIKGEILQKVISHSIEDWTGNGHWLQISGFAFRHDPDKKVANQLTLLTKDGPRLINPNEELLVVTNEFLIDSTIGNQDGYVMLNTHQVEYNSSNEGEKNLRQLVENDIQKNGSKGIAPKVEGRICNTKEQRGPCLLDGEAEKNEITPNGKLYGTLTDSASENPISNAQVSLYLVMKENSTTQKSITNMDGNFTMPLWGAGEATITYIAEGYLPIKEEGFPLKSSSDLSKVMKKVDSIGGWWVLIVLAPGILGLVVASRQEARRRAEAQSALVKLSGTASPSGKAQPQDNQFFIAMVSGLIWGGTLAALLWMGRLYEQGVYTIRLFTPSLTFELYVPILGFLGALLYVLDLSRRGKEDIPKGKEFGMRLIMGPYVAIIMVILFGHELGLANLSSPVARGTLAFFSGLLVVTALQGLIERAQEKLGKWRKESMDDPAKISDRLDLSPEEELLIRKSEFEKEQLEKALGGPIWEQLKESKITTVEEFSHLTDQSLEQLAAKVSPPAELEDLKLLRTKAKKFGNLQ